METFIEFFTFQYPNIKYVVFGSILLSISASIVGCFTFVKKKSLLGDVISHAVLPGICISFLISETKDPLLLVVGAFISGWLSVLVMDEIVQKTKLKEDTATGIALSVFFGIGILILTYIQRGGNAAQSGLDSFLFGKAAALVGQDLLVFSIIALLVLLTVGTFYKEFKLISFDWDFAMSIGKPVRKLEFLLTSLTVLAVVTGIQAVGVVLMAAMLITPAAAARFWSNRFSRMMVLAATFASLSGVTGAYISYAVPSMPTGPWIVMVLSLIAIFSFLFAPRRGIAIRIFRRSSIQRKLLEENILKALYKEVSSSDDRSISRERLAGLGFFDPQKLQKGIRRLKFHGYLYASASGYELTEQGYEKGMGIVRLHRLWELYLTKYLNIASDHVHEDAETMEHVLTPEIEEKLEALLEYPEADPHDAEIPRK